MSGATTTAREPRGDKLENFVRRFLRPILWAVVVLPAIWGVYALFTDKLGANPIEEIEHFTGKWTLRLIAASLAVTPLIRLTGWGWLIPQRRFLGLAAFAWAVTHFFMYMGLDMFFNVHDIVEDIVKHLYITVGMLALVLMIPLALTSTKASIRRLGGKKWNRLHQLIYVSAIAGCIHFLWAVKKDHEEPLLYTTVILALLISRLVLPKPGPRRRSETPGAGAVTG